MWARTNTNPYYSDAISWKPTPRRIYANWKPVNVSRRWWQLTLAVSLPTTSFTTSYNKPMIRPDPDTLRGPNLICLPYYTANTPRCLLTKLYRPNQKNRHGPRRIMVYTNTWLCTLGEDPQCLGPKTFHQWQFIPFLDLKISRCWNVN